MGAGASGGSQPGSRLLRSMKFEAPQPRVVLVAAHHPHEPDQRLVGRKHLDHPGPALDLRVHAPLDVVGPYPDPVRAGEVEVGQGRRRGLLEQLRPRGVARAKQLAGAPVAGPHEPRVGLGERECC